jgi:hypothetical protein
MDEDDCGAVSSCPPSLTNQPTYRKLPSVPVLPVPLVGMLVNDDEWCCSLQKFYLSTTPTGTVLVLLFTERVWGVDRPIVLPVVVVVLVVTFGQRVRTATRVCVGALVVSFWWVSKFDPGVSKVICDCD